MQKSSCKFSIHSSRISTTRAPSFMFGSYEYAKSSSNNIKWLYCARKKRKEEKKNQHEELLRFAGSSAWLPQLRWNCKRSHAAWLFGAARIQKKEQLRRLVPTKTRCLQSSMLPFWPHATSVQLAATLAVWTAPLLAAILNKTLLIFELRFDFSNL